jgi:hypothetical protein
LVLNGVAQMDGRRFGGRSAALLVLVATGWWLGGSDARSLFWNSAGPIGRRGVAALLAGYDRKAAQLVGQTVADRFASTPHGGETAIRATVSVGLAELGADGTDLSMLMAAADRALYCAKALGRNRVEVAPPFSAVA